MKYQIKTEDLPLDMRIAITDYLDTIGVAHSTTSKPEPTRSEKRYRLEIYHDDGEFYEDPREHWGDEAPTIMPIRAGYLSTLTETPFKDDPTLRAYQHMDEHLIDPLTATQRFERIFGQGRPVEVVTLSGYSQSDWMELLVIGEDLGGYLKEFEAWWNGEFYGGNLFEVTTTTYEDGTEDEDEALVESMGGIMVYDLDFETEVPEALGMTKEDLAITEIEGPF